MFSPHVTHERAPMPEHLSTFFTFKLPVCTVYNQHMGQHVRTQREPLATVSTLVRPFLGVREEVLGQSAAGAECLRAVTALVGLGPRVFQLMLDQVTAVVILHWTLVTSKLLVFFLSFAMRRHVIFEFCDKHPALRANLAPILVVAQMPIQVFLVFKQFRALWTFEHLMGVGGAVVAVSAGFVGERFVAQLTQEAMSQLMLTQFSASVEALVAGQTVELEF